MKNAISWFEIPTENFERAVKFYSQLLGKEVKVDEFMGQKLGFFPMEKNGEVGGDLMPPSKENKPSKFGTRVYLNCEGRLDDVLEMVEKIGGRVVQPKMSIEDMGWIALIGDTEGNVVGLYSES